MIHFTESVDVAADRSRVWRALTIPSEVVIWDTGIVRPLDAPDDYPAPGQHVRWSYRLGPIRLTLHDRPTEVETNPRLRSSIRLGPFEFDEIYTLVDRSDKEGPGRRPGTHLEVSLTLLGRVPILRAQFENMVGRPLARATVRTSLAAIRAHCETAP